MGDIWLLPANWPEWLTYTLLTVDLLIRIAMLGIVPGGRRPTTAMAWLLAIFLLPYVGLIVFLLFGSHRLNRPRRERQEAVNREIMTAVGPDPLDRVPGHFPRWVTSVSELNQNLTGYPLAGGNRFRFDADYKNILKTMAEDIDSANDYVHVEFYIAGIDQEYTEPVFQALERAAARGVKVRFLFDQIGSWRLPGYRKMKERLTEAGIEWYRMLPIAPFKWRWRRPDLRNHRKILVVDGRVGMTGSINLIEPSYLRRSAHRKGREWIDMMARIEGPMVDHLDLIFATDWYLESGKKVFDQLQFAEHDRPADTLAQMIPSGPGYPQENNLRMFNSLIYNASRQVRITTPYLVPDDSLLYALTTAAQAGVDVELYLCREGDNKITNHAQQSYYDTLLEAGVEIYRYPSPDVLHSKCVTVDDTVGVFGSSNMDMRSFSLNNEITVLTLGSECVASLNEIMDSYKAESELLTKEAWASRSRIERWLDNVARLTAVVQ